MVKTMSEYNKILYKVFMQVKDGWKFIGTFDSSYQAYAYMEDHYPYAKYEIEAEGSFD